MDVHVVPWGRRIISFLALAVIASTLAAVGPTTGTAQAATPTGFVQVTAGGHHTCSVIATGDAYCWGNDNRGELGNGAPTSDQASPVLVSTPAGVTGWASLTAGHDHSCGVTTTAEAYCWGADANGQLGNGAASGHDLASPSLVDTPDGVTGWASLTAGDIHSCGVTAVGDAYCWGSDGQGRLGNGAASGHDLASPSLVDTPDGVTGWASLTAGANHTCGVTAAGEAFCWGSDANGRLGNGATAGNQASPVPVDTLAGATGWATLTAGRFHACGVTTTGEAYCWGHDNNGQLGNGTTTGDQASPSLVDTPSGVTWATLAAGSYHTCGVSTAGETYCWGRDSFGNLGNGDTNGHDLASPALVDTPAGVTGWVSVTAGLDLTCGVTTVGDAYCWGDDEFGQLGNGDPTGDQTSPSLVDLPPLPQSISFGELADVTFGDDPIVLSATASSGLAVGYSAEGDCEVAASMVTITGAGECTVTATQPGNDDWAAAEDVVRAFAIDPAGVMLDAVPTGSVGYGGTVANTATVASTVAGVDATGEVTFALYGPGDPDCIAAPVFTDTVDLDTAGSATSGEFAPDAGVYRWVVTYSGDTDHQPAVLACGAAGGEVAVAAAATRVDVDPVVLSTRGWLIRITLGAVSARLSNADDGTPLRGEVIRFRAGGRTVCTAVTGTDGRASCRLDLAGTLAVIVAFGVHADYPGSLNHTSSTGTAGLL